MYNCLVRQTRKKDEFLTLEQRTDDANGAGADLFFSIHLNASKNHKGYGYEDYIHDSLSDTSATAKIREKFHSMMIDNALTKYKIRNRGKKKANFHVLRETDMPAILVETLFIDNATDDAILDKPTFLDDMAWSYARAIGHAMDLPERLPEQGTDLWYRVQVGAFRNKDNAVELMNKLRKAGYPAIITIGK